jgi:hypothetical protein
VTITVCGGMKETMMASVLVTSSLVNDFDDCGFIVKYGYNLLIYFLSSSRTTTKFIYIRCNEHYSFETPN